MSAAQAPAGAGAKATRREWLALAVIALPCMVYAMDMTVLNLAIPVITAELRPTAAQMLWIIDIYGFMVASFLITMGTLGDKLGRRRLLLLGAAAFAAASALAAFATSAEALIALRALLGLAGATLAPSTLSLISNMFHDEQERRFAVGVWISSFSLGAVIGPLAGGVLLQYFGWPAIFLAAVPVMALLLILGPALLPEYKDPAAGRLDLVSVALSLLVVLSLVFAIKRLAEGGTTGPVLAATIVGVGAGLAFARRQHRIQYPLLDLALFRSARFRAAIVTYGLASFAMFGIYILITQYLQVLEDLSPLAAGLCTIPWAAAFLVGSLGTARLTRHVTPYRVVTRGLALGAIGFLLLLGAGTPQGLLWTIAGMVVMGLGMAPVITLGNETVVTSAPPERAGAASALSETGAELSGALGVALMGSLAMVLYRTSMAPVLSAAPGAGQQEAASTLAGAFALANQLPAAQAGPLLAQAREAFLSGMDAVAVAGAICMLLAMALSAWQLRAGH